MAEQTVQDRSYISPPESLVKVTKGDLVKIDGIGIFRAYRRGGILYMEIIDHDRYRSNLRGTRTVEIPFQLLQEKLAQIPDEKDNSNDGYDQTSTDSIEGRGRDCTEDLAGGSQSRGQAEVLRRDLSDR